MAERRKLKVYNTSGKNYVQLHYHPEGPMVEAVRFRQAHTDSGLV